LARMSADELQPLLIIGRGSNLLLTGDFPGTVVRSAVMGMELVGQQGSDVLLRCGSGELWDAVVRRSIDMGLYGMENLSLIPGDVGATAVQNIGAYGVEASHIIYSVEAVEMATGRRVQLPAAACGYAYRQSRFKGEWKNRYLITHVTYRLSRHFRPRLDYGNLRSVADSCHGRSLSALDVRNAVISIRRQKLPDPDVEGNAGSFFMNPVVERSRYDALLNRYPDMPCYPVSDSHVKIPAGWLIDRAGWKGRCMGPAAVHDRQALVLVNRGGASGQDILRLCRAIQQDVWNRYGIELQPEVNIV